MAQSDRFVLNDEYGIFDTVSGEKVEIPEGVGLLPFAFAQWIAARRNVKSFEEDRRDWQAFIIERLNGQAYRYDGEVYYPTTNRRTVIDHDELINRLAEHDMLNEKTMLALIKAARAFKKDELPDEIRELYVKSLRQSETTSYLKQEEHL